MDQFAEHGVLLRRSSDNGERPDCALAMVNFVHVQNREIMLQAVVSQMITKGAFWHLPRWIDGAGDAKVRVGINRSRIRLTNHRDTMSR